MPLKILPSYTNKSRIVYYEALRNDRSLFNELCNSFDLVPITNLAERYNQPSSKTHPKSEFKAGSSSSPKLIKKELQEVNAILDIFECELYARN